MLLDWRRLSWIAHNWKFYEIDLTLPGGCIGGKVCLKYLSKEREVGVVTTESSIVIYGSFFVIGDIYMSRRRNLDSLRRYTNFRTWVGLVWKIRVWCVDLASNFFTKNLNSNFLWFCSGHSFFQTSNSSYQMIFFLPIIGILRAIEMPILNFGIP